jgi:hypothetical protein
MKLGRNIAQEDAPDPRPNPAAAEDRGRESLPEKTVGDALAPPKKRARSRKEIRVYLPKELATEFDAYVAVFRAKMPGASHVSAALLVRLDSAAPSTQGTGT